MYMQKAVLMVPAHIEQECNVIDALRTGAGVSANEFDLDALLGFLPAYTKSMEFNYWTRTAEALFLYELTRIDYQPSTIFAPL
jgi:hypothetical protein